MNIKRLFLFLILIITVKNLVFKENYDQSEIDELIKKNTPDMSELGINQQQELDPLDPEYADKLNQQVQSQIQKDLNNENAFVVTEDGTQVSGVRHKSKPEIINTVGGQKKEKEGRGMNEVIVLIIILIVLSKFI